MEVFVREKEKDKYESFAFSAYYHKYRIGEENIGKKNCLVQDFWSDDSEDLPKLSVKSLDQHDAEVKKPLEDEIKRLNKKIKEISKHIDPVKEAVDFFKELIDEKFK